MGYAPQKRLLSRDRSILFPRRFQISGNQKFSSFYPRIRCDSPHVIHFVNVSTLSAQATEVSAVTIVESGGDVKGTTRNVESGVLTATGTVSIDAEDIIAELATSDLEISVGSLAVDSPINWSASTVLSLTSAGDLAINETIKATGATAGLELLSPGAYTLNVENGASIQLTGTAPTLSINSTPFTVINTRAQLEALTSSSTNIALGRSITLTDKDQPEDDGPSFG